MKWLIYLAIGLMAFKASAATNMVRVGDQLHYQLGCTNGPFKVTFVNGFLKMSDGVVIQWLINQVMEPGEQIVCPGNAKCANTNLLSYTVRLQDLGKSVTFTNETFVCRSIAGPKDVPAIQFVIGKSITGSNYNDCHKLLATVVFGRK